MQLVRRTRLAALALGAAFALLAPTAAGATTPLMTDLAGDANVGAYACQPSLGLGAVDPCPTSVAALSEPAIDIVEGDIVEDGTDLHFTVELLDIDAAPLVGAADRQFEFGTTYAGLSVHLRVSGIGQSDTTATGTVKFIDVAATGGGASVDVTLDPSTNVLTWAVPLSVLNAELAATCGTCTSMGSGSTFQDFSAVAAYQTDQVGVSCAVRCDGAEASTSYTLS